MYKILKTTSLIVLSTVVLSGCVASSPNVSRLEEQVQTQQQTIQSLNSQISGVQPAQADTWSQIQTLRQEMASMRGTLDNLEVALRPLGGASALGDILARQDRALRLIEAQFGMDLQLDEPALPQPTASSSASMGSMVTSGTNYSSTGLAAPAYSTAPVQAAVTAPSSSAPISMDTAQALYDMGMDAYNARNYDSAVTAFTDFTNTFQSSSSMPDAYYWQGESYYQLGNYAAAALAYENVIAQYPNSVRAPSAYLKQAMSFIELDKTDAAKERIGQLIAEYPRAPEATRAQQILASL